MSPSSRQAAVTSSCELRLATVAWAAVFMASVAQAQTPMTPASGDFATAATQSDQFEIVEAQTVLAQSADMRIRAFAQEMMDDHTATSRRLRQAMISSGMTALPTGLSGDQQKMLGALQSLRGSDFDRTYAKQQVLAHDQALVVERSYATDGSDAQLRSAAQSAVPVIERHLDMARQMRATLGGS